MSQQELLITVVRVLDQLEIDYMLTGSLASSAQGEPRATHDIDLVVNIDVRAVNDLIRHFPKADYYLSKEAITNAIVHRSMFNLLSLTDGEKVDFWILGRHRYDTTAFQRKIVEMIGGQPVKMSAPEDTILSKLRWDQMLEGSEKQFIDILRVYELQYSLLDQGYLDYWAAELNVQERLAQIRQQAKPVEL